MIYSNLYDCNLLLWNSGSVDGNAYLHKGISELDCDQIYLGPLPAGEIRKLKIEIHPHQGLSGDSLTFDIQFELWGSGFCDTEGSTGNYFLLG